MGKRGGDKESRGSCGDVVRRRGMSVEGMVNFGLNVVSFLVIYGGIDGTWSGYMCPRTTCPRCIMLNMHWKQLQWILK